MAWLLHINYGRDKIGKGKNLINRLQKIKQLEGLIMIKELQYYNKESLTKGVVILIIIGILVGWVLS